MFSLIKFESGDYWITLSRNVLEKSDGGKSVKFRGSRYAAKTIIKSDDKDYLKECQKKYTSQSSSENYTSTYQLSSNSPSSPVPSYQKDLALRKKKIRINLNQSSSNTKLISEKAAYPSQNCFSKKELTARTRSQNLQKNSKPAISNSNLISKNITCPANCKQTPPSQPLPFLSTCTSTHKTCISAVTTNVIDSFSPNVSFKKDSSAANIIGFPSGPVSSEAAPLKQVSQTTVSKQNLRTFSAASPPDVLTFQKRAREENDSDTARLTSGSILRSELVPSSNNGFLENLVNEASKDDSCAVNSISSLSYIAVAPNLSPVAQISKAKINKKLQIIPTCGGNSHQVARSSSPPLMSEYISARKNSISAAIHNYITTDCIKNEFVISNFNFNSSSADSVSFQALQVKQVSEATTTAPLQSDITSTLQISTCEEIDTETARSNSVPLLWSERVPSSNNPFTKNPVNKVLNDNSCAVNSTSSSSYIAVVPNLSSIEQISTEKIKRKLQIIPTFNSERGNFQENSHKIRLYSPPLFREFISAHKYSISTVTIDHFFLKASFQNDFSVGKFNLNSSSLDTTTFKAQHVKQIQEVKTDEQNLQTYKAPLQSYNAFTLQNRPCEEFYTEIARSNSVPLLWPEHIPSYNTSSSSSKVKNVKQNPVNVILKDDPCAINLTPSYSSNEIATHSTLKQSSTANKKQKIEIISQQIFNTNSFTYQQYTNQIPGSYSPPLQSEYLSSCKNSPSTADYNFSPTGSFKNDSVIGKINLNSSSSDSILFKDLPVTQVPEAITVLQNLKNYSTPLQSDNAFRFQNHLCEEIDTKIARSNSEPLLWSEHKPSCMRSSLSSIVKTFKQSPVNDTSVINSFTSSSNTSLEQILTPNIKENLDTVAQQIFTPNTSFTSESVTCEDNSHQKTQSSLSPSCTAVNNSISASALKNPLDSTVNTDPSVFSNTTISEYFPDTTIEIMDDNLNSTDDSLLKRNTTTEFLERPLKISNVTVPYTNRDSKKHFCIFCNTLQTQLPRHLFSKHCSEQQIKDALNFPKKSKERLQIIEALRKKGDFLHNTSENHNSGILIVSRRQQAKMQNSAGGYVCCRNCKAFFSKRTLRIHLKRCGMKKNARDNLICARKLTQYFHGEANMVLRSKILPVLRDDNITKAIAYDELIIKYGNKLSEKYTLSHQHDMIRSQLRLLGRFLIEVKALKSDINELKDIFKPNLFDTCVNALRKVAKWDDTLMWFGAPAVAQQLTSLIKKCGSKQRTEFIKTQSDEQKKNLENFLLLWEEEIPVLINKKAMDDQCNKKREKKIILPSKADIQKLYLFLKNKMLDAIHKLESDFNVEYWTELVKSSLIFIQLFNRRRAGEIERLTINSYLNKEAITENIDNEIIKNMSKESVAFAKQFVRLVLRGKLGRTVSVLLNPLCVKAIDLILKYRTHAGIEKNNEYIFSKKVSSKFAKPYYRACPLLKQFSFDCEAKMPESLRGTELRKHIATYISMLNIEEATVDRLANFMGHHKDVHKNVYRVSVPVAEITCVSKLLMSAVGDEDGVEEEDEEVEEEGEEAMNAEENNIEVIGDQEKTDSNGKESRKRRSTSPYGKTKRNKWSQEERDAIFSIFGDLKKLEKLPSGMQCLDAINHNDALKNRTPQQLKSWIDNQRRYK